LMLSVVDLAKDPVDPRHPLPDHLIVLP
jgi:hypothetical protein